MRNTSLLLILCGLTSSCNLGVSPCYPPTEMSYEWKETTECCTPSAFPGKFWTLFNDETLNCLEEQAINSSPNLTIAVGRIVQAEALLEKAHSRRLFDLNWNTGLDKQQYLIRPAEFGAPFTGLRRVQQQAYTSLFNFSYEVDMWGKLKDRESAAWESLNASHWAFDFAIQTLTTEVARLYFITRTLDEEIVFLKQAVNVRKDQVDINSARVKAGLDPEIDLSRARLELEIAMGDLENSERIRALSEHALAVAVGVPPSCFILEPGTLPSEIPPPPCFTPSETLLMRPDVQQSWSLVASSFYDVNAAQKNLYPSFPLTLVGGVESPSLSSWWTWEGRFWEYALNMAAPLYDGGLRCSDVLFNKGVWIERFYQYKNTLLIAFQDVEDSLSDYFYRKLQYETELRALEAAKDTAYLAEAQFEAGIITFLLVADSQNTALNTEIKAIALKGEQALSWVRLVRAFGAASPLSDDCKDPSID